MIIQVNNRVLIVFSPKKIVILSPYLHPLKKQDSYSGKTYFFQFQYPQTLKFIYLFLYVKKICFITFRFFQSNQDFALSLWPQFF